MGKTQPRSGARGIVVAVVTSLALIAFMGVSAPSALAVPTETPANLHVTGVTTTTFTVAWDAPSTAYVDTFVTLQGPSPTGGLYGNAIGGGWWPGPVTEQTASGLVCGSTYTMTVAFSDGPPATGDPTSTAGPAGSITVTTADCTKPQPPQPTGLEVTFVEANALYFEWDAPADPDVTGVSLLLSGAGRNGAATYGAERVFYDSWTNSSHPLVCEETYTFSLVWTNDEGRSSPTASVTETTASCDELGPPGPAPTGLTLTAPGRTSLAFAWDPAPEPSAVWLTRTVISAGAYSDVRYSSRALTTGRRSGLTCATSYSFSVQWVYLDGSRSIPSSLDATTTACPTVMSPPAVVQPPPAPIAAPPPPDKTPPQIVVTSRRVVVSAKRVATITLRCIRDTSCRGELRLVPAKRKIGGRRLPASFGTARFVIAGAPTRVRVVVPKRAFAMLRKLRAVDVIAKATARDAAGNAGSLSTRVKLVAPRGR